MRRETAEIGTLDIDSAFPALVKLNAGAASMQHSDISAQREGKTVIVFKAVRLTAEDILAMELKDGETVTLDLTVALDVDELSQLIDKDPTKLSSALASPRSRSLRS